MLSYLREQSGLSDGQKSRAWSALNISAFCYLRKAVDQPDKVLDLLAEDTLSEFDVSDENRAKAYKHRMNAWIKKDNPEKVATVAERLYSSYPDASASIQALGDAASYFESKREGASSEEDREAFHEKEISFYYRWIARKLSTGVSEQNVLSVAVKVMEFAIETGSRKDLKRSKELLSALTSGNFNGEPIRVTGESVDLDVVKSQLARVYSELGNLARAGELYEQLLGADETTLSVLLGRAHLYIKQMKQAKQNKKRDQLEQLAESAEKFINDDLIEAAEPDSETWFRGWKLLAEVKLVSGLDQQGARFIFERLRDRGNNPFGGNVDMFKELLENYPDKMGDLQVTN